MSHKNRPTFFLIGIVAVMLLLLPLIVAVTQKKQDTMSKASNASTTIQFSQGTSLQVNQGDIIPLDITINPGTNLVSFLKVVISYDPSILKLSTEAPFQTNTVVFPVTLAGPLYTSGNISAELSIGPDITKAITSVSEVGRITFTAIKKTNVTTVQFTPETIALSVDPDNSASENVISAKTPIQIKIAPGTSKGRK